MSNAHRGHQGLPVKRNMKCFQFANKLKYGHIGFGYWIWLYGLEFIIKFNLGIILIFKARK